MKNIRSFITGFTFALVLMLTVHAFAGIATFKADLVTIVTNDFVAGDRQRIANAFVNAYPSEWAARVAAGTADTVANRGAFAADKIVDYVKAIVNGTEQQTNLSAAPTPTPLPNE